MALADEVQDRYSDEKLTQLTNPDNRGTGATAVAIDTARLDKAVLDAQSRFKTRTQLVYDETDADHIALGVDGVVAFLIMRGGTGSKADARIGDYHEALDRFAQFGPRKRVTAKTLTPTRPSKAREGTEPTFDTTRFDGVVLDGGPASTVQKRDNSDSGSGS